MALNWHRYMSIIAKSISHALLKVMSKCNVSALHRIQCMVVEVVLCINLYGRSYHCIIQKTFISLLK